MQTQTDFVVILANSTENRFAYPTLERARSVVSYFQSDAERSWNDAGIYERTETFETVEFSGMEIANPDTVVEAYRFVEGVPSVGV